MNTCIPAWMQILKENPVPARSSNVCVVKWLVPVTYDRPGCQQQPPGELCSLGWCCCANIKLANLHFRASCQPFRLENKTPFVTRASYLQHVKPTEMNRARTGSEGSKQAFTWSYIKEYKVHTFRSRCKLFIFLFYFYFFWDRGGGGHGFTWRVSWLSIAASCSNENQWFFKLIQKAVHIFMFVFL